MSHRVKISAQGIGHGFPPFLERNFHQFGDQKDYALACSDRMQRSSAPSLLNQKCLLRDGFRTFDAGFCRAKAGRSRNGRLSRCRYCSRKNLATRRMGARRGNLNGGLFNRIRDARWKITAAAFLSQRAQESSREENNECAHDGRARINMYDVPRGCPEHLARMERDAC